jgi:ABC-type nickel/cobalt efflux system permease component RcnA
MLAGIGVWMLLRAWRRTNHHHASQGMMVGVMAGLIPCPLTLFVMIYALSRGVPEAGIVFAIAIMLGVTLTLSSVAILTVSVRNSVTTLIERYGGHLARSMHGGENSQSGSALMGILADDRRADVARL